jgi:hypothetical protein
MVLRESSCGKKIGTQASDWIKKEGRTWARHAAELRDWTGSMR